MLEQQGTPAHQSNIACYCAAWPCSLYVCVSACLCVCEQAQIEDGHGMAERVSRSVRRLDDIQMRVQRALALVEDVINLQGCAEVKRCLRCLGRIVTNLFPSCWWYLKSLFQLPQQVFVSANCTKTCV